jgi:hypothetical protein
MKKKQLKVLGLIAEKLPRVTYLASMERAEWTGEDALLAGTEEIDGKPVDPEKTYQVRVPLVRDWDHKRRMKEAYKREGRMGVIKYCRPFVRPDSFGKFQVLIMNNLT